ncbi:MAG: endo-1,4-beta-xylanase [Caulobacterales bacterium]
MPGLNRRLILAASAALAACGSSPPEGRSAPPRPGATPALRELAPFPMGVAVSDGHLADPAFAALVASQFSQVTPDFEMKMEYILLPDGTYRFDRPDRIAAFTRAHGQRLYCTTLIWYAQDPVAFHPLDGAGQRFADAFDRYIADVMGRYRGQAVGWDVVNEPVAEDGDGLRASIWSRNLGATDYMVRAFEQAKAADPEAVLFINEYGFESKPAKLATFLRLVEGLLKRGVEIGGIGTQTHVNIDTPPGAILNAVGEVARFGLPVHLSELDCSFRGGRPLDLRPVGEKLQAQARVYGEAMEAFLRLPPRQRFAFTMWGARDRDSFLRDPPNAGDGTDQPLAFTDDGEPKPAFWALADALSRRAKA